MQTLVITGIAALFLATGTAHASGHSTFYECGQYRIWNIFNAMEKPDETYWLVSKYDDGPGKRIPLRMIKRKGGTVQVVGTSGGQSIKQFIPDYYYRGKKCEEISRAQALEKWQ